MTPRLTRFDVTATANRLRLQHGSQAIDEALQTARHHLQTAEWKKGAQWLQVVNHLRSYTNTQHTLSLSA